VELVVFSTNIGRVVENGFSILRDNIDLVIKCTFVLPCSSKTLVIRVVKCKNENQLRGMKKDLITHFIYMLAFLILVALYKQWISIEYLPLLFGGIIGTFLPDVDHLIYVYFLRPNESMSKQVSSLVENKNFVKSWDMLANTRAERKNLIIHSAHFQLIFLVFAFLVITSSGSLLGRGLVLAFSLHLLIDQIIDYMETKNLDHWFTKIPMILSAEQKRWYLVGNIIVLLLLGFLF